VCVCVCGLSDRRTGSEQRSDKVKCLLSKRICFSFIRDEFQNLGGASGCLKSNEIVMSRRAAERELEQRSHRNRRRERDYGWEACQGQAHTLTQDRSKGFSESARIRFIRQTLLVSNLPFTFLSVNFELLLV
jgi:hypothetical protein